MVPYRPAGTERGLQWFKTAFRLPVIPIQIPIALYQTRSNGVIGEEQKQAIQQNPTSFLYKYWTARKVENNAAFTIALPTKTTFNGCMAK